MSSEIARIKQQIEEMCQAMQRGLTGYAGVAKHRIVSHRYNQLNACTKQLEPLVGKEEATTILCEAYTKLVENGE